MKTVLEIKQHIAKLKKELEDCDKEKKAADTLSAKKRCDRRRKLASNRIKDLKPILMYAESEPTEESMVATIEKLNHKLSCISNRFDDWCKLNQVNLHNIQEKVAKATRAKYEKEFEVKKLRQQVKNITYLLG